LDFAAVIGEVARLSELHTLSGAHRTFGISPVAAEARLLKATTFLSFHANQRKLATAVRLAVGP
jgi:hypothetical protein